MLNNPWTFLKISADGTDVTSPTELDNVWTAREPNGLASEPKLKYSCDGWTSSTSDSTFLAFDFREDGLSDESYDDEQDYNFCNLPARLICMKQ